MVKYLHYIAHLIISMAVSSWKMLICALRGRPDHISIVHVRPKAGERARVVVSNSITLTPGTITLEETPDEYTVLCMGDDKDADVRKEVDDFERLLGKGECHD